MVVFVLGAGGKNTVRTGTEPTSQTTEKGGGAPRLHKFDGCTKAPSATEKGEAVTSSAVSVAIRMAMQLLTRSCKHACVR